jgi:hypothetical protein
LTLLQIYQLQGIACHGCRVILKFHSSHVRQNGKRRRKAGASGSLAKLFDNFPFYGQLDYSLPCISIHRYRFIELPAFAAL